jgi:hypothetical protein
MSLVEQYQGVMGRKPCLDRGCESADAVTAKQKPRPDLINGAANNRGLRRCSRPGLVSVNAPPQFKDFQRVGCGVSGEFFQALGNLVQNASRRSLAQRFGQAEGLLISLVHNYTPVHNEANTPQSLALSWRQMGLRCKAEHGNVQAGCFPAGGRQGDSFWPALVRAFLSEHALSQSYLPRKRLSASSNSSEEVPKVSDVKSRHPKTSSLRKGRQNP